METILNRFGELQTTWTSHKHPNNPNFMQVVKYMHIQFKDGRNNLYWSLYNGCANDKHMIPNISLEEAKSLYVDIEEEQITEEHFQEWLKNREKKE